MQHNSSSRQPVSQLHQAPLPFSPGCLPSHYAITMTKARLWLAWLLDTNVHSSFMNILLSLGEEQDIGHRGRKAPKGGYSAPFPRARAWPGKLRGLA